MVVKPDHERVKALLAESITVLCKNGLSYKAKFTIQGLIGITLDDEDVFLVDIHEKVGEDVPAPSPKQVAPPSPAAKRSESSVRTQKRAQPEATWSRTKMLRTETAHASSGANERTEGKQARKDPECDLEMSVMDIGDMAQDSENWSETITAAGEQLQIQRTDQGSQDYSQTPKSEESDTRTQKLKVEEPEVILVKEESEAEFQESTFQPFLSAETAPQRPPPLPSFEPQPGTSSWGLGMEGSSQEAAQAQATETGTGMSSEEPYDVDASQDSSFADETSRGSEGGTLRQDVWRSRRNLRGYAAHSQSSQHGHPSYQLTEQSLDPSTFAGHRSGRTKIKGRSKRPCRCGICDKVFYQSYNLRRHMLIHTGARPFGCDLCGKCYNQKESLKRHTCKPGKVQPGTVRPVLKDHCYL